VEMNDRIFFVASRLNPQTFREFGVTIKKKKVMKYLAKAILIFVVLAGVCYWCLPKYYVFDRKDLAKLQLQRLGMMVCKLSIENQLTLEVWNKINSMEDLAPLLASMIDDGIGSFRDPWGNPYLLDPWGDPYLLEKRKEDGKIIVIIRSNREVNPESKRKVWGVEITVSEQDGLVHGIKELWSDD
jgi:hypothetical protein